MNHNASLVKRLLGSPVKRFQDFGIRWGYIFPLFFLIFALTMSSMAISDTVNKVGEQNPAQVKQIADESTFNSIILEEKAEDRLGIKTALVKRRIVLRTKLYGGELILPLDQLPADSEQTLGKERQSVFTILPLMTPADQIRVAEAQVNAEAQVEAAKVQVKAALVVLKRAQRLLRDHAAVNARSMKPESNFNWLKPLWRKHKPDVNCLGLLSWLPRFQIGSGYACRSMSVI